MLGVKLVRGAYQPLELSVWERKRVEMMDGKNVDVENEPPVWCVKKDTDDCYNEVGSPSKKRCSWKGTGLTRYNS